MSNGARAVVIVVAASLGGCSTHTLIGGLSGTGGAVVGGGMGGAVSQVDGAIGGQDGTAPGDGAIGPDGAGGGVTQVCGAGTGNTDGSQPAGTPSFRPVDYVFGGTNVSAIAIGDVTGDGKPDLAVVSDEGVNVLFNNGDGSFQPPTTNSNFAQSAELVMGDVNGDGKLDLAQILGTNGHGASVLLNEGNGVFGSAMEYPVTSMATSLALADLNGDGQADIVLTDSVNASSSSVVVLLSTGSGTFTTASYGVPGAPSSVAVGDLNGDGKPDLAVGSYSNTPSGGMLVLLNAGKGTFGAAAMFGANTNPTMMAIADLNGDGKADLAGLPGNGHVDVLLNLGAGTFTVPTSYFVGGGTNDRQTFAWGDFNRDGAPDVALASDQAGVRVVLNAGDGTFGAPATIPSTCDFNDDSLRHLAVADLNGDGKLDIVVDIANGVEVLLNTSP
jgi:hypothetical protein